MLLGFTTENALNSLYIVRKPNSIVSGKLHFMDGSKAIGGHSLNDLARVEHLSVNKHEEQLLAFLECVTLSFGRYPTATTANKSPRSQTIHTSIFGDANRLMLRAIRIALDDWSLTSTLTRRTADATMKYIEHDLNTA